MILMRYQTKPGTAWRKARALTLGKGGSQPPKKRMTTSEDDEHHVGVLGHVEVGELHARIFGVVAGDELGLGLGQVEGRAVRLGHGRDPEDDERDGHEEAVPDARRLLAADDLDEVHGPGDEGHRQDGQAGRDLVAQDLDDRAQGPHERVLGVRGPAAEDDAEDGDRRQAQDDEQADRALGDPQGRAYRSRCGWARRGG